MKINATPGQINAVQFRLVQFFDQNANPPRPIVVIYALGDDGVIYEFSGGKWIPFPINSQTIRQPQTQPKPRSHR